MKKNGFTLIEVLIALAIVTIAFTAILSTSAHSLRNTQYLQNKMIANWVAAKVINDIRAKFLSLPTTEPLTDETTMLAKKYSWQAKLQTTANPHIQKINVTVWQPPSTAKLIDLISYVYV